LSAGLNLGSRKTDVPGGTANWTFTGGINYNDQSGSVAIVINKADATVSVSGYTGVYDGAAHGATGTATGVGGVNLSAGLNLGATHTNFPGGMANWTFTGGINYNDQSGSVAIVINKASSTTVVTFEPGPYMYRGTAFPATAVVTGAGGLNQPVAVVYSGDCTKVTVTNGCTAAATFAGDTNHTGSSDSKSITITTAFAFNGFYSPIGGSEENGNGGSFADPVRAFKLGSTIPVKFGATWLNGGAPLITGVHTLQAFKYSNATTSDPVIDASPTDSATTGNEFRLTSPDWHFNLSTKVGFSAGTWLLRATLVDGSTHTVWITIKK
jgi:hypothetical protein